MKTFKMPPRYHMKMAMKSFGIVAALITVLFTMYIFVSAFKTGIHNLDAPTFFTAFGLLVLPSVGLCFLCSLLAAFIQRPMWESLEIELGDREIVKKQRRRREIRMKYSEIGSLEKGGSYLFLFTKDKKGSMYIPKDIDGFDELKGLLEEKTGKK